MKLALSIAAFLSLFAAESCMLRQAGIQPIKIQGIAMSPTLNDGDLVVITTRFENLQRADIVLFHYPQDPAKSYFKRIIGLPGEVIEISEGRVSINGKSLVEAYVNPANNLSSRSFGKISLSTDSFFVMGDNRDNSNDSRAWGPLPRSFIYGKFVSKYHAAN